MCFGRFRPDFSEDFERKMTRSQSIIDERRWVFIFAIIVIVLTSIPYLVGYARQGDDWIFTGFVFGVEDGNSYIAKMLGGGSGAGPGSVLRPSTLLVVKIA